MTNNIFLPEKFQIIEDKNDPYSLELSFEPCASGYGLTIGNALRRILLSSLVGGSVFAIKIKGVKHEFDTIDGIKEDVIEIILNIKKLILKIHTDDVVILELKKKGKGDVLASDIKINADVDIINSDLKIATIIDENAEIDIKFWVRNGIGFYPTENRKEKIDEVGAISIDANFNPIILANFRVEKTRVGDIVDLDKVILTVKTNGSIGPRKAIRDSLNILINNLELIRENVNEKDDKESITKNKVAKEKPKKEKEAKKKPVTKKTTTAKKSKK
ncbi:DNA-directed RNA polymerase subunit alpha [Patescibacteria group bacterium]|mgnify:FL=1|nr:DNA-directed RNA polymerase subunit alpha [Caldisericia bacterium]MBP8689363.1 DNA-directed RNA polymerase subunit alpha [Patescibacteria group bacterium]